MKIYSLLLLIFLTCAITHKSSAQINEDQLGAWYMLFFDAKLKDKQFGVQGDIQYRNWNIAGDLEQLLIRGGLTYRPKKANMKLTLGFANITTGEFGTGKSTSNENRVYQEALIPHKIGDRVYLNHRFRYEQRFVANQDFRTRYRYNLFVNVPLNHSKIVENTVYLALYNELFINGQRNIGNGNQVEIFDRNRLYLGAGYAIKKNLKVQLGIMNQTTDGWKKNQLQVSLHSNF